MVPLRRRRLLQVATAATAGLAGCNGLESTSGDEEPEDSEDPPVSPGSASDPSFGLLRASGTRYLAWFSEERPTPTRGDSLGYDRTAVIDSDERADAMRLAEVDGAAEVRRFVAETDFSESAVYVDQVAIADCRRAQLCEISWRSDGIDVEYGTRSLPYDVACEADATQTEARFVRLPAPLSRDEIREYSASLSGGPCRDGGTAPTAGRTRTQNRTDTPDATNATPGEGGR